MDTGLKGKVVVITGAASGIGLGCVEAFLAEGSHVVGGDLDPGALEGMEGVTPVQADLSSLSGPKDLIERAVAEHGTVDVLVNNVGIAPYRESFLSTTDEDWQQVMDLNFYAMARSARAAIPHMVAQNRGAIVSIASDVGRQPDVFFVDYGVSKAAVLSLSKALSIEFGPKGIRSNCVSPGPTRTALWDRPGGFADSLAEEFGMDKEAAIDHFAKEVRKLPLGKLGQPGDVAAAVVFLSSDLAGQVTGSDYAVDGGVKVTA